MADLTVVNLPDSEVDEALDAELRNLLSVCFVRTPCFRERRYCHEVPLHRWMIRDTAEGLVAQVALHAKEVYHGREAIRCGGVAEVCVHPDYRGRGYVRKLLGEVHAWLRERGVPFAVLYGATDIYASSGYASVANLFRDIANEDGTVRRHAMDWAMVAALGDRAWPDGEVFLPGPSILSIKKARRGGGLFLVGSFA